MGASASTMLSSAELICLCLAMARSSRPGRNCALPAPGGSIYLSGERPFGTLSRIVHFGGVSCVHCAGFAFLFLVDIVGISKVSFVLYLFVFFGLSYQYIINHRMQATLKLSLLNSDSFELIPVRMLSVLLLLTIFSCSCSFSSLQQSLESR